MSRKLGTAAQEALARDPGKALAAICQMRQELDEIEEAQVANALARGWSWARIGRALGVSRQAVHRKYSGCTPAPVTLSQPTLARNLRMAILIARTEAAARGDALVGSEHLLLGLLQLGEGCAADALRAAGAELRALRAAVDAISPTDVCSVRPSQIGLTSRALAAVESANRAAMRDGAERVTEEHLLRALLRLRDGGAVLALAATGVAPRDVAAALDRILESPPRRTPRGAASAPRAVA